MATENSILDGEKLMEKMNRTAQAALLSRIERKELITQDELILRLGCNRRWGGDALKAGRFFFLQAPSGSGYFPSFFSNSLYDGRSLCRVAKVLVRLPAPSRYQFFLNKLFPLGMTPLQALAEGRVKDVLIFASGFAER